MTKTRIITLLSVVLLLAAAMTVAVAKEPTNVTMLVAQEDPSHISFTLEGCRNPSVDVNVPNPICADGDYTTGNLGKTWNELDLVPHRITTQAGNAAPANQTYRVAAAADSFDAGHPGYDVMSAPVLNVAKSDASCSIVAGPQQDAIPGVGGTDESIYRFLDITQAKNTTCVFDYYERLALGSHLFPGSSLHSNLLNQDLKQAGIGNKDVSIPVKEILPQELDKTMEAEQDQAHSWTLEKAATPDSVDFEDTCSIAPLPDLSSTITVTWTRSEPFPSGEIMVTTDVFATNPAHRTITVNVTDEIRSGTTVLDTVNSGDVDVPPETSDFLVLTHQTTVPEGSTDLNDVATATYIDKVTGVPVPGETVATASAEVVFSGTVLDASATITDTESISGANLSFSVGAPSVGSFVGYVADTPTTGPVNWTYDANGSGSVDFNKTIYLSEPTIVTGLLEDTAELNGSDGFGPIFASADVDIFANATVELTINKTIPDVLQTGESVTFSFDVSGPDGYANTVDIEFTSGETSDSTTLSGLAPGTYTVSEQLLAPWNANADQVVDINLPDCSGSVSFDNDFPRASARVKKVTDPPGFEEDWTFTLSGPGGPDYASTTGAGFVNFSLVLQEGDYTITETPQAGWSNTGTSGECSFTVDYPADSGKVFECTFENTYQPTVDIDKTGDELSKRGDKVDYKITTTNTSSVGGPAGVPDLKCTISDPTVGVNKVVTLPAGASDVIDVIDFVIPNDAPDPFPNTASVSCTYPGLTDVVASDSDGHSINLFQPSVKVEKGGPTYSKVGDTNEYTYTITNTSSADSPDLVLVSVFDDVIGDLTTAASGAGCSTLAPNTSCNFSAFYVVQAGDDTGLPGATLVNKVTVHYNPDGFPNDIKHETSHTVILIHPSFNVSKSCDAEPISYLGPADFTVTIANTGDVPLDISADDGIGSFQLAAGASQNFAVSVPGPFTPGGTADNTVTASWELPELFGLSNTASMSASDSCDVLQPVFETAYALGVDESPTCFLDLGAGNWGWVHGDGQNAVRPGTYTWDLWAGASQCDTANGTLVGTVTVVYDGDTGEVSVTFNVNAPYILDATHVYASYDQLTKFSPGQYTNEGPFDGSPVYISVHAVVGIPQ